MSSGNSPPNIYTFFEPSDWLAGQPRPSKGVKVWGKASLQPRPSKAVKVWGKGLGV